MLTKRRSVLKGALLLQSLHVMKTKGGAVCPCAQQDGRIFIETLPLTCPQPKNSLH